MATDGSRDNHEGDQSDQVHQTSDAQAEERWRKERV